LANETALPLRRLGDEATPKIPGFSTQKAAVGNDDRLTSIINNSTTRAWNFKLKSRERSLSTGILFSITCPSRNSGKQIAIELFEIGVFKAIVVLDHQDVS